MLTVGGGDLHMARGRHRNLSWGHSRIGVRTAVSVGLG